MKLRLVTYFVFVTSEMGFLRTCSCLFVMINGVEKKKFVSLCFYEFPQIDLRMLSKEYHRVEYQKNFCFIF